MATTPNKPVKTSGKPAKKKTTKKKKVVEDWYDNYKHGFDADKEKRKFYDAMYALGITLLGVVLFILALVVDKYI